VAQHIGPLSDISSHIWYASSDLRSLSTGCYGINASGQVTGTIITAGNFAYRAFLWDGMSMLDLNDLIAPGSGWILEQGLAINDAGQITGFGTVGDESHPFLLTPVTVAEVPEPGTLALMSIGAIGLGLLRRRKSRSNAGAQARRDPTLNRLCSMTLISRGHRSQGQQRGWSGGATHSNHAREIGHRFSIFDTEAVAEAAPKRDAQLPAGLPQAEESGAAVASDVGTRSSADLATRPDIVLRAVGVQGDFQPFQRPRQLVPVGVQPLQQPVEHGEPGAALEDALEAPAQG
jgi:probable HAF family extracellular repeat protein